MNFLLLGNIAIIIRTSGIPPSFILLPGKASEDGDGFVGVGHTLFLLPKEGFSILR